MNEQREEITSPFHRRPVQITLSGIVLLVMVGVMAFDRWIGHGKHAVNAGDPFRKGRERLFEDQPSAGLMLRIDLNQATTRELTLLPGIGPVLATRILADRRNNGHFRSIEDLARVPGIGTKTIQEVRSICFVVEDVVAESGDEVPKQPRSDQFNSHEDD